MHPLPWLLLATVALLACGRGEPESAPHQGNMQPPMAAASGVTRADGGKEPREHRVIPMRPMTGDVEILYGEPELPGEPFVIRIRELAGTVVPPHSHPVDEHITVVQGVWYFGFGERYDPTQLRELGVNVEDIPELAFQALAEITTIFNPRPAGLEELIGLFQKAF